MDLVTFVNTLWSILSVAAEALTVFLIAALFVPALRESAVGRFFRTRAILVAFVVSLLAMIGSLTYSNVIGYAPCELCWFQRILMYPQALIMGMALWRRDQGMKIYGLVMSLIGALIALYHYSGQLGLSPLPCSATGYAVSCAKEFVLLYGYITIPMMAFSAFMLIAATLMLSLRAGDHTPYV